MKTFTTSFLVLSSAFMAAVTASPAVMFSNANVDPAECADQGGVLQISAADLPEGTLLSDVRKCADHPLGRDRKKETWSIPPPAEEGDNSTSPVPRAGQDISQTQACYYDAAYGCTYEGGTGYCWKHCGASNDGT